MLLNKYYILCLLFACILILISLKHKEHFTTNTTNNYLYTAVMVEPRKHPAFEFVMTNFLNNLSDAWGFVIFHGNKNENYINDIINNKLLKYKNRITLKKIGVDNLTVLEYSKLLASKSFYDDIPTETFLIFQTDTLICGEHKDLINEFINYDYVGAPWINGGVGNGGLSIRKKSKMLEIINKCPYKGEPEDVYFAESCSNIYRNKPSFEKAKKFSVENVYNKISFGIHKSWVYSNDKQLSVKNKQCKGLTQLKKLNS